MKKFLMGLSAASLLVLSACNQAPAPNGQAGTGQMPGPMPGTGQGPGPMQGPQPGPGQMPQQPGGMSGMPGPGGGQQTAAMVQQAVQQCVQAGGNSPQAQQMCGCFGQALANLPPQQLQALDSNPQQAQQFAMQVMQQCAGSLGMGQQGPGGYGGMNPGMLSGALQGAQGNSTK